VAPLRHQNPRRHPRYWATTAPGRIALREFDRELTYAELDQRTDEVAAAIAGAGIRLGACIAMPAQNSLEFFELWFGAARAGCALSPLNWRCPKAELVELIADAGASLIVAGQGRGAGWPARC
jgi:acyl-CoA synthetase (AMP-forming)/AMP-acid ligase II